MKKLIAGAVVAGAMFALTGCQSNQTKIEETKQAATAELNNEDLYEVMHEGRYYVFDDFSTYQSFLEVGETSYRKVYIGGGPHSETLVFGLMGKDKKKTSGIAAIDMYNGKLEAAESFYGEMRGEDGRLYVFSTLEDMEDIRVVGEAPYRFTQIAAGPQGQTVVFVLNKSNKKQQPDALIAKFKQMNNMH
ncbi:hypothetical protein [uncultured Neptuniibacter sp.]|uniref:hypothetical protein n=1 Tax=uncultured Neptuniibacter sp. TaxID=502143 RepID=UPI0026319D28|nr:hypothetical protein [uncultured Neptuniibacter sp.]